MQAVVIRVFFVIFQTMANSAQSPIPSASFQIPFEPHPIPYLPTDDEEESFVVLGKSLTDLDLGESPGPVVDKSIVEELRSLIKDELKEIADDAEQQADSVRTTTTQVEQNTTVCGPVLAVFFTVFHRFSFRFAGFIGRIAEYDFDKFYRFNSNEIGGDYSRE